MVKFFFTKFEWMNWNTKWIPIFLISRIVSCSPDPTPNPTNFVKIVLIGQKTFSYSDLGFVRSFRIGCRIWWTICTLFCIKSYLKLFKLKRTYVGLCNAIFTIQTPCGHKIIFFLKDHYHFHPPYKFYANYPWIILSIK